LNSLPAEIGNLTNLTRLWLYINDLSSLPAEIVNLTNLTDLRIGGNYLAKVSPEVGAFLDEKEPDWSATQRVAPGEIDITPILPNAITSLEIEDESLEYKLFLPLISN